MSHHQHVPLNAKSFVEPVPPGHNDFVGVMRESDAVKPIELKLLRLSCFQVSSRKTGTELSAVRWTRLA